MRRRAASSLAQSRSSHLARPAPGDGSDIQAHLAETTGQRTVPSVFVNGKFIGGCSDAEKLHREGKLVSLVEASA